jgi:N-methylhydantoinase B
MMAVQTNASHVSPTSVQRLDAMTLEVLRHGLEEIAEAMNVALMMAAYSTNITDRRDSSCAIFLPTVEAVAQSQTGTPLHLGVMPFVVQGILARIPLETMAPGDQYIMNTPYPNGPGHLNDIALLAPIFCEGRLIALAANQAHHVDVGGIVPGSMSANATEIFQEGLQIPPVALIRGGELVDDVLSIFLANIRSPEVSRGDLLAQAAANNVGASRVAALGERWGVDLLGAAMEELLSHGERRMRADISSLADGSYEAEDSIEGPNGPIYIRATIEIDGDTITADFSKTDPEVAAPLNCRIPTLRACLAYVVSATLNPGVAPNAGALRPLLVTAPEGILVNAKFPNATVQANVITSPRICDVLIRALYEVVPERVVAACQGTTCLVLIGGEDTKLHQELFTYIESHGGGSGGALERDGQSAVQTHMSNSLNSPIEVLEQTFPFKILRYELRPDSSGHGRRRGGFGMRKEIQLTTDATVTVHFARLETQPWGLAGGGDGDGARVERTRAGQTEVLSGRGTFHFEAGDVLTLQSPGGGGYGPATQRDPDAVAADVAAGLISPEYAQRHYPHASEAGK